MDFVLREWRYDDAASVQKYGDNPKIAQYLRDGFPHPYNLDSARSFINGCMKADKAQKLFYPIDIGGEAIGSVGVFKKDDVYRKSAELGYWLGEPFWGRGIMTRAVYLMSRIAFAHLDIVRISAEPYAHNAGSRRVLENAGFELEGVHKRSVYKNGQLFDSCAYALLRTDVGGDTLAALSNEELWSLFPVIVTEHQPAWALKYELEACVLRSFIGADIIARMSHIGSTSVGGLDAKPTVDILLEVKKDADLETLKNAMCKAGYIFSPQPNNPPPHMMFMRGYTPEGFKGQVFHVHVRYPGDWDELYFSNFLKHHQDAAASYAVLKRKLALKYEHDRDKYTFEKTDFIRAITQEARKEFGKIYELTKSGGVNADKPVI